MSSGSRSTNSPPAREQPSFCLACGIAIIAGSIIILSCSATSEKTPTSAQNSRQSSASGLRNDDSKRLRSLALKGDAEAQYRLAKRYATRYGAAGDYVQALHWWQLAAQQGLAKAQYALGVLYANGRGVSTDYARAVYWYQQAADQGLPEAQYNLGTHYWLGKGVPWDAAMAVKWLREAAEQGLPQAQYNLGLLLERGLGTPRNLEEARQWYARAAAQGLPAAQRELQAPPDTLPTRSALP